MITTGTGDSVAEEPAHSREGGGAGSQCPLDDVNSARATDVSVVFNSPIIGGLKVVLPVTRVLGRYGGRKSPERTLKNMAPRSQSPESTCQWKSEHNQDSVWEHSHSVVRLYFTGTPARARVLGRTGIRSTCASKMGGNLSPEPLN